MSYLNGLVPPAAAGAAGVAGVVVVVVVVPKGAAVFGVAVEIGSPGVLDVPVKLGGVSEIPRGSGLSLVLRTVVPDCSRVGFVLTVLTVVMSGLTCVVPDAELLRRGNRDAA
jgi:hypothetical protein